MLEFAKKLSFNEDTDDDILYIENVDSYHPDYAKYAPRWEKARDIIEGEDEIKALGKRETYLPRLSGHTNTSEGKADYNSFVEYAELYNATGRTVEAYRGLLNRKLPLIRTPKKMEEMLDHITIKDESIYTFLEQMETEIITTNRVGIFIDYPYYDNANGPLTKDRAEKLNMTPYLSMYTTESIINWSESRINNKIVTDMVVLKEVDYVRTTAFAPEEITTYRILELDEEGYYRQVIVQDMTISNNTGSQKRGTYSVVKDTVYPMQNGEYMTYIPFYPVTAQGITWDLSKSIIEDLVNVNIAHYRDTAFHQKAIAWTASPTAVFSGLPDDSPSIGIGSSQAIVIAPGGTAKYLEYEGRGLTDIANALEKKEVQMAVLGAKILGAEKRGVESGLAATVHRAGEQGILADVANSVGTAMTKALKIIADWAGISYQYSKIRVDINKDFTPVPIDANTIVALSKEVDAGHISYESYVWALQRGEIIPSDTTPAEELKAIKRTHTPMIKSSKQNIAYVNKKDNFEYLEADEEDDSGVGGNQMTPEPQNLGINNSPEE